MDLNRRIGVRLKQLRTARALSIEALAAATGVSRSAISLVERGGSSPTATVLDRLASGLGVTPAAFFDDAAATPSPVSRAEAQPRWTDPASGYTRRNLSPPAPGPLTLVEVTFPPGQEVAYETGGRPHIHQQVWLLEGRMHVQVGDAGWELGPGDCLALDLRRPVAFRSTGDGPSRYLVAVVEPAGARLPESAGPAASRGGRG